MGGRVSEGRGNSSLTPFFRDFKTRTEARSAIFEWIEVFYNRERLHETLDYVSPMRYEEQTVVP